MHIAHCFTDKDNAVLRDFSIFRNLDSENRGLGKGIYDNEVAGEGVEKISV